MPGTIRAFEIDQKLLVALVRFVRDVEHFDRGRKAGALDAAVRTIKARAARLRERIDGPQEVDPETPGAPLASVMPDIIEYVTLRMPRGWTPFLFFWDGTALVGSGPPEINKAELLLALRDWCDQEEDIADGAAEE